MQLFVAFLVLAALIGGMALYKHRAKIKAAALAEAEAEDLKNSAKAKIGKL